jgi:hypothetical protein
MQNPFNAWTGGTLWLLLAGTAWLMLVPAALTGAAFIGLNVLVLAVALTLALLHGHRAPAGTVAVHEVEGSHPPSAATQGIRSR